MSVKKTMMMAQQDIARARLMQQGEIAEEKMEQNEDLAKLRAGVSLAKTGVQQAIVTEDNYAIKQKGKKIMKSMKKQYGKKKGEKIFYASKNKGVIKGVKKGA